MAKKSKTSSKDIMLPHSAAKVEFYEKYLERYLAVMNGSQWFDTVHIYDVFCGRGVYDDGGLGSPIRAVRTIIKTKQAKPSNTRFVLHLNDLNPEHISKVKDYVEANYPDFRNYCTIMSSNMDAEVLLDELCYKLSNTPNNERNLLFIDPYGYKSIHKETLYKLMANGKTEILLFLAVSFMHRFRQYAFEEDSNEGVKRLREFIGSFFSPSHPVRQQHEMDVREYIRYLSRAFSFDDRFYSTAYHIERDSNSYFALFFICSNLYGFHKILEVKWNLDEEDGNGFQQPDLMMDLFADFNKQERQREMFETLRTSLIEYLRTSRTNAALYEFVLKQEFLPHHAGTILKDLQNNGQLNVRSFIGTKPVRKGTFYLTYDGYKNPSVVIEIKK